jgi:pimeloyl-ACP methyl ester carboxylesterase
MKHEYGLLPGGIPFIHCGSDPAPLVVLNGGQAFMRRSSQERFEREARRIGRILPAKQSFLLLGYSGSPPRDLERVVDDLASALRSLASPIRLAGISYGGIVALRLAARHPDLVSDLILIASAHRFSAEGLSRVRRQIDHASRGRYPELLQEFGGVFRRPWFNWLLRLRLTLKRRSLAEEMNDPDVICAYLRAGLEASSRDDVAWLRQVRARTLIIGGERDQYFGDSRMEETARALPDAQLHLLPGETHMAPVERATDVQRAIAAFLARLGDTLGRSPERHLKDRKVQR